MKTARSFINVIISAFLGMFGLSGCLVAMYGVPQGTINFEGTVTDEKDKPLEGIKTGFSCGWTDGAGNTSYMWQSALYTDADGRYFGTMISEGGKMFRIIATDTSGIYAPDTVETAVNYRGGHGWDMGTANVVQNLSLKKNPVADAALLPGTWLLERLCVTSESVTYGGITSEEHEPDCDFVWIFTSDSIAHPYVRTKANDHESVDVEIRSDETQAVSNRYTLHGSANTLTVAEEPAQGKTVYYRVRLLTADRLVLETAERRVVHVDDSDYVFIDTLNYFFSRRYWTCGTTD